MHISIPARLGAACWAAAAPLFLAANVIVGLAWPRPYSWATNNISDLGNVHCGQWDSTRPRYVCSPWHGTMNVAILVTAILLGLGLVLAWRAAGRGVAVRAAQVLLLAPVVGYLLVGTNPADVDENTHLFGALLIMGLGNLGLLVAAFARRDTVLGRMRPVTVAAAVVSLAGALLFFGQQGMGIGLGTMERFAVFPFPIWATVVGIVLLTRRARRPAATPAPAHG